MMKSLGAGVFAAGGGMVLASLVAVEAVAGVLVLYQIGGGTEVMGITLAWLMGAAVTSLGAIAWGSWRLIKFGGVVKGWLDALNAASALPAQVAANAEAIGANARAISDFEEWRATVHPTIMTWMERTGARRGLGS